MTHPLQRLPDPLDEGPPGILVLLAIIGAIVVYPFLPARAQTIETADSNPVLDEWAAQQAAADVARLRNTVGHVVECDGEDVHYVDDAAMVDFLMDVRRWSYLEGHRDGRDELRAELEDLPPVCIDINEADIVQLQKLHGVGEARARAIIAHRPYDRVEDLTRVPGIKAVRLGKIMGPPDDSPVPCVDP